MKRFLIITFFGMFMMHADAQDSTAMQQRIMFGVHAGAGPATMVGRDMYWGSGANDLTYMIGSVYGIVFQYRVSRRISLCFEANVERKGYAVAFLTYPSMWDMDGSIPWNGRMKYFYDCISIPVLAQFKINKLKKRTEWFVKTGLSPEYMVRSGVIYGDKKKRYEDIQHIDFSTVFGFGVNIPIKKHVVISIEGRDNLTIGDLLNFKKHNLAVLMVGFGYKI